MKKWMFAVGICALAIIGIWAMPDDRIDSSPDRPRHQPSDSRQLGSEPGGAVGTSGAHDGAAEGNESNAVREIETITGANDGMALVGRRVDLHVDVQDIANDRAFWVGSADNRVLVVLGRDNRNGAQRQTGAPSSHGIAPVHDGQRAMISGVIRPMPRAEDMTGWALTVDEKKELAERKIYIRADTVSSEGHGTF
jgi:hypothetical protein